MQYSPEGTMRTQAGGGAKQKPLQTEDKPDNKPPKGVTE